MKTSFATLVFDLDGYYSESDIRKVLNAIPQNDWHFGDSDGYTLNEDHWDYDEEQDLTTFDGSISINVTDTKVVYVEVIKHEIYQALTLAADYVWNVNVTLPHDRTIDPYAEFSDLYGLDDA